MPLEKLDAFSASGAAPRETFDAVALQRRGLVFDPTQEAPPVAAISGATDLREVTKSQTGSSKVEVEKTPLDCSW